MRSLVLVMLVGCATTAPSDPFDVDLASGASDGAGVTVLEVAPGDQLALSVDAGELLALRARTTAAIAVRRTSGDLDPFILVKDAAKRTLAQSDDQVIAPALDPRDAIVVAPAAAFVLVGGEGLATGGELVIDVIALPAPRALALEGTIARLAGGRLRELEPARADAVAKGYLAERADGGVEELRAAIPIAERAAMTRLASELAATRATLAEALVPGTTSDATSDATADALADLAAIWAAL